MRKFDAILFDMDGTLVDSEPFHTLAWTRLAESFGHSPPEGWLDAFVGESDTKTQHDIIAIYPDLGDKGDILKMKQGIFRELIARNGDKLAMPGIATPLRQLAAAGVPMAVGTNGVLMNCRAVLRAAGLLPFFPVLATFDQAARGKPAPDIYTIAAQRLGADAARCVVVEDSATGVASGKAAGCFVAGVASTRPPQDLSAADTVLPDTAAALEWIIEQFTENTGGEAHAHSWTKVSGK